VTQNHLMSQEQVRPPAPRADVETPSGRIRSRDPMDCVPLTLLYSANVDPLPPRGKLIVAVGHIERRGRRRSGLRVRGVQSPSVSLILRANASSVKGFWIKGMCASTIPRWPRRRPCTRT